MAAHLCRHWRSYTSSEIQDFDDAAEKLLDFIRSDVRGRIIRRFPYRRLIHQWGRTRFLTESYKKLYRDTDAEEDAPPRPTLHVLATNLTNGCLWSFDEEHLKIYDADECMSFTTPSIGIGTKIGASSAFPGFFPPMRFRASDLGLDQRDFQPAEQFVTDGGVYDNLGIRRARLLVDESAQEQRPISLVLISDAGAAFDLSSSRKLGLFGTAMRSADILMERIGRVDLEVAGWRDTRAEGSSLSGIYQVASIKAEIRREEDPHATNEDLQRSLKFIRTDFDHFSDFEILCLVAHGYCVTRRLIRGLVGLSPSESIGDADREAFQREVAVIPDCAPWCPSSVTTSCSILKQRDHRGSIALRRIQRARKRRLRLFNVRDYMTYVNVLALVVVIAAPFFVERCFRLPIPV